MDMDMEIRCVHCGTGSPAPDWRIAGFRTTSMSCTPCFDLALWQVPMTDATGTPYYRYPEVRNKHGVLLGWPLHLSLAYPRDDEVYAPEFGGTPCP